MLAFLNKTRRGETLLEILIALFVLGTTSSAATFLIIQSNRESLNIQQQFQARYLAREAFDYLKMVRNTNWIRFGDTACWAIDLNEKDCAKQNPKEIAENNPRDYALASGKPGDIYFHLTPVTDKDAFTDCVAFTQSTDNPYAIYANKTNDLDLYNGLMYSPDPVPPADQRPLFCRKITLTKVHDDAIEAKVFISWRIGAQQHDREYTSYLLNY